MRFGDCNLFIRWALQFKLNSDKEIYTSLDCRLFYIVKGSGDIIINKNKHHFSNSTVFLWPAYTEYQFLCDSPIEIISINFDYDRSRVTRTKPFSPIKKSLSGAPLIETYQNVNFENTKSLNAPIVCQNTEILKILQSIVSEINSEKPLLYEKSASLLKAAIVDILRNYDTPNMQSTSTVPKLEKLMKYIHTHYMENITNEDLASIVNYHPNYMNRVFLKTNGITIHQYIIKYRINIAEHQLISTDIPIATIAENIGFSCVISFTNNFRKIKGLSPSEYRKKFKKNV